MTKWKYCTITGCKTGSATHQFDTHYPKITYFTSEGRNTESLGGSRPDGLYEANAVARLIAQLGEEGWEMVGCGNTAEVTHSIYFKRPPPDNSQHSSCES